MAKRSGQAKARAKVKAKPKPKRGRPAVDDPLAILLAVRINRRVEAAAEQYRQRHELASIGAAVRHAAEATFQREGLLPDQAD
jgi:hypothetical protein